MMQSVFANLKKPKYKPVDLKAFDEAISEGIAREYKSSQILKAINQRNEFPGAGRDASRGRGQYNQSYRDVSGELFQNSANFNNTNRNYGQYNQGHQDDDSYMEDIEIFGQYDQTYENDDSYMEDIETFDQYNHTYENDGLYAQSTEKFDKGRARNTNFSRSYNNEYGNATQPSKRYAYQSYPLQGQRNDNIPPQSTPAFGRGRGAFLNNNNIQETLVQPKERHSNNIFVSTGPIIGNEYDSHTSLNMGGPDRGFGASSNNINTKGWYVQPGERQTHQPFVSKQSTLEHQSDNQNASAKSGFNKSRLGFNNSKGQRNFAQPSEKSLASRQSTPKSQNDNVNLSSNSGLGRGRKGLENRGRMNISQSSEGYISHLYHLYHHKTNV